MSKPRATIRWQDLSFTPPLEPVHTVHALRGIATMHSAPKVVIETTGSDRGVAWRIGTPQETAKSVRDVLITHLSGLRITEGSRREQVDFAVQLRIRGHRDRQTTTSSGTTATRSLLAALALGGPSEALVVQIILGYRLKPTLAPVSSHGASGQTERRRARALKIGEHGFSCVVRVGVRTGSPKRARGLIGHVLAAWRSLEAPGVSFRLTRTSVRSFNDVASPWQWPLSLSVSELVGLIGWPVGALPLPGVAPAHPRTLPIPEAVPRSGRRLGRGLAAGQPRPVAVSVSDSLRHLHIVGPTGTGKSTLLANLAIADMTAGRGLAVIDPKGDLVDDLLARIPPQRQADVVLLDATDQTPVGLNPLSAGDPELAADTVLSVFRDMYAPSWGPRTQDILHACLLSLARRGDASLVLVPLLLTNAGFRRSIVGRVAKSDPIGLGSFWAWFDGVSEGERQAAIAPLMNKLRPLLLRPGLRAVLGQTAPRFNIAEVFTDKHILLANLAKGQLGSEGALLLGSLLVSMLWQAARRRSSIPQARRHPVMVLIDEVQDYLRLHGDIGDALAQARSLGVSFTLAHQHLSQLPTTLRSAVLANARSRVCFQLSHEDATTLAKGSGLTPEDLTSLPAFQAYAAVLVGGTPTPFGSIVTQPLPPASSDPEVIRRRSRDRYGRPLSQVEAAWLEIAVPEPPAGGLGRREIGAGG